MFLPPFFLGDESFFPFVRRKLDWKRTGFAGDFLAETGNQNQVSRKFITHAPEYH
jgi:hypothetical protein